MARIEVTIATTSHGIIKMDRYFPEVDDCSSAVRKVLYQIADDMIAAHEVKQRN